MEGGELVLLSIMIDKKYYFHLQRENLAVDLNTYKGLLNAYDKNVMDKVSYHE